MDFERPVDLVKACRQGDPAAWDELLARYGKLIWSVAQKSGLNSDEAEEIFQRTWVAVVAGIDRIEKPDRLASWIAATARNQVYQFFQEARRQRRDEAMHDSVPAEIDNHLEVQQRDACVRDALAQMDPRCRELLELLFFVDPAPDYQEVGQLLDLKVGSIGPTRARCLKKLKKIFVTMYQTVDDNDS